MVTIQLTVFTVAGNRLAHAGQVDQRQIMAAEAQPDTLWLTGAGFHGIDSTDFAPEQCIAQRGFADAGFSHDANHRFIRNESVELLQQMLA